MAVEAQEDVKLAASEAEAEAKASATQEVNTQSAAQQAVDREPTLIAVDLSGCRETPNNWRKRST